MFQYTLDSAVKKEEAHTVLHVWAEPLVEACALLADEHVLRTGGVAEVPGDEVTQLRGREGRRRDRAGLATVREERRLVAGLVVPEARLELVQHLGEFAEVLLATRHDDRVARAVLHHEDVRLRMKVEQVPGHPTIVGAIDRAADHLVALRRNLERQFGLDGLGPLAGLAISLAGPSEQVLDFVVDLLDEDLLGRELELLDTRETERVLDRVDRGDVELRRHEVVIEDPEDRLDDLHHVLSTRDVVSDPRPVVDQVEQVRSEPVLQRAVRVVQIEPADEVVHAGNRPEVEVLVRLVVDDPLRRRAVAGRLVVGDRVDVDERVRQRLTGVVEDDGGIAQLLRLDVGQQDVERSELVQLGRVRQQERGGHVGTSLAMHHHGAWRMVESHVLLPWTIQEICFTRGCKRTVCRTEDIRYDPPVRPARIRPFIEKVKTCKALLG